MYVWRVKRGNGLESESSTLTSANTFQECRRLFIKSRRVYVSIGYQHASFPTIATVLEFGAWYNSAITCARLLHRLSRLPSFVNKTSSQGDLTENAFACVSMMSLCAAAHSFCLFCLNMYIYLKLMEWLRRVVEIKG